MGTLTPGATLIYERADGIIYAREAGAEPSTRRVVGYERGADYDPYRTTVDWNKMCEAAKTNPALKTALEQCIMLYNLIKDE
jgi:hypothetical protein